MVRGKRIRNEGHQVWRREEVREIVAEKATDSHADEGRCFRLPLTLSFDV